MFLVWEREELGGGFGNVMAEYLAEVCRASAGFCFGLYKDTRWCALYLFCVQTPARSHPTPPMCQAVHTTFCWKQVLHHAESHTVFWMAFIQPFLCA